MKYQTYLPIPYAEALGHIVQTCADLAIKHLVVGAYARDLLCKYVHNLRPKRLTSDLDLAIMVENWAAFTEIETALIGKGFRLTSSPHTLKYQGTDFDIVPFGQIAGPGGIVAWPDTSLTMNVTGFSECLRHAVEFEDRGGTLFSTPDLPCLAFLKFVSWLDRPNERPHDVEDIAFIVSSYWDASEERIYEEHTDLFNAIPFETSVAGARVLGRDIKLRFQADQIGYVLQKLADPGLRSLFDNAARATFEQAGIGSSLVDTLVIELGT